uniref:SHSP domain-containing protein n=1 Tax=Haemonchus contortus TaxID=6289 RepID=A0A7I5E5E5_HAECO
MSLCILPSTTEEAILPRPVDDVCSELDDASNLFHEIEDFFPPPLRVRAEEREATVRLCKVTDDESKLAISLDVSKFKPDELKVNINGRTVTVEGMQEVKEGSSFTARSFLRQCTIPEEVDVEQIRSTLSKDGHLTIEAPKLKPAITERSIPIEQAIEQ